MRKYNYKRPYVVRIVFPWVTRTFRYSSKKSALAAVYKKQGNFFCIGSRVSIGSKILYPPKDVK